MGELAGFELRDAHDRAAALARLRAVEPHAVDGTSAESMAAGAFLLDVCEGGRVVGALALALAGEVAYVRAAAADTRDFVQQLALLETAARAHGARRLELDTRRPGLVRRMLAAGYGIRCCSMTRDL